MTLISDRSNRRFPLSGIRFRIQVPLASLGTCTKSNQHMQTATLSRSPEYQHSIFITLLSPEPQNPIILFVIQTWQTFTSTRVLLYSLFVFSTPPTRLSVFQGCDVQTCQDKNLAPNPSPHHLRIPEPQSPSSFRWYPSIHLESY